jgi:hypothetical protein
MKSFLKRLKNFFSPQTQICKHIWRPCLAVLHTWSDERKPSRICALCKDWEPLTEEQFFAQFGETFYQYPKVVDSTTRRSQKET